MPKYKIGIDYSFKGLIYIEIDADNEEEAEQLAESYAEDRAVADLDNSNFECEVCDVIPG